MARKVTKRTIKHGDVLSGNPGAPSIVKSGTGIAGGGKKVIKGPGTGASVGAKLGGK